MPEDDVTKARNDDAMLQTIGLLVVNASHIEGAICRVICWVDGETPHSVTPEVAAMGVSQLLREIRRRAKTSADAQRVVDLLKEHDVETLFTVRHNVVHGGVFLRGSETFIAVRYPWKDRPSAMVVDTRDNLEQTSRRCAELWAAIYEVLPPSPVRSFD